MAGMRPSSDNPGWLCDNAGYLRSDGYGAVPLYYNCIGRDTTQNPRHAEGSQDGPTEP
jgi:hypothetical protein